MNDLKGIIEDCNKSDLVSNKIIRKVIEIIGQEEWQDLHDENNDVCTTTGELIITLKGIEELEKENDRLARKCECLTNNNESLIDIVNDVERLEKENESLTNIKNIYIGDLLKAKELLSWWVNHCGYHDLNYAKKTEQFLKE